MLGAKEEGWRDAKFRKLDHKNGESAGGPGDEEDDEQASDVETEIVVGLRRSRLTSISSRQAAAWGSICSGSAQPGKRLDAAVEDLLLVTVIAGKFPLK